MAEISDATFATYDRLWRAFIKWARENECTRELLGPEGPEIAGQFLRELSPRYKATSLRLYAWAIVTAERQLSKHPELWAAGIPGPMVEALHAPRPSTGWC